MFYKLSAILGSMQRALLDLRLDLDSIAHSESPYEALYNASSCHSLDSICSGRSSDRDSLCPENSKTRHVSGFAHGFVAFINFYIVNYLIVTCF